MSSNGCPPPRLSVNMPNSALSYSFPLPSLPPGRLRVLEGEPACPLICASLAADSPVAAGKQNAPRRHSSQETGANAAEAERGDTRLGPHAVAVEGVRRVEKRRDGERRHRVRRLWVRVFGRHTWMQLEWL
jgi:hypothetical protein